MNSDQRLEKVVRIMFIGMAVFFTFSFVCTRYKGFEYPIGDFMFLPWDTFMDFINVNEMMAKGDPYLTWGSSYPPAMLAVAFFFSLFADYDTLGAKVVVEQIAGKASYLLFIILSSAAIIFLLYRLLRKNVNNPRKLWIMIPLLLFNAPFIYAVDRGNYILIVILIFLAFMECYETKPYLAAVLLGIAAAMKIYPLFLFLFFFINKKYKQMGTAILAGGLATLIPLLFFNGGIVKNVYNFLVAVFRFGTGKNGVASTTAFSVGLTSLLQLPCVFFNKGIEYENFPLMKIFILVGTALTLWSLWNLRKEKNWVRQFVVLVILMVFLTPNSYLYNVLYLLGPMVMLIVSKEKQSRWDRVAFVLLALLFIPKSYWYYTVPGGYVSIAVLFDSLILLGLILFYNIEQTLLKREDKLCREKV